MNEPLMEIGEVLSIGIKSFAAHPFFSMGAGIILDGDKGSAYNGQIGRIQYQCSVA